MEMTILRCLQKLISLEDPTRFHPVNYNLQNPRGQTLLSLAIVQGCHLLVKLLLQQPSVDPNVSDYIGYTPLHYACFYGYQAMVQLLLESNRIDLGVRSAQGLTVLDL